MIYTLIETTQKTRWHIELATVRTWTASGMKLWLIADPMSAKQRAEYGAKRVQWDITSGKAQPSHPDPSATWVPVLLKVTLLRHVLLHSHGLCLWRLEVGEV